MQLESICTIVTGGASGLGRAVVELFAKKGAHAAIFDTDEEAGRTVAKAAGGAFFKVDVTNASQMAKSMAAAQSALGPPRILVNCAGVGASAKTVDRNGAPHPLDMFSKILAVNVTGTFNAITQFAALAAQNEPIGEERGVIINTASIAAYDGQMGQAAYAASKGGVISMTLPVARDLARYGVRVCTIAPGLFLTPMLNGAPEAVRTSLAQSVPFPQRLGDPGEYALLAEQIVANPMLNGETIRLDAALRMAPK